MIQKTIFLCTAFLLTMMSSAVAQDNINATEAKSHINDSKTYTVCGKNAGVKATKGGMTFINFDNPFPNHTFTLVILKEYKDNFSQAFLSEIVEADNVCGIGKITTYKDNPIPQIVIEKPEQIILK